MLRQSLVIKILKHVPDRFHNRQPNVQVASCLENGIEILDEIANWRAGAKVAADHAPAMLLQDPAVAVTARQGLGDFCRVGATGAGQQQRLGDAGDFGAVVAFLCSRQARFITGENVLVDGGAYAGLV